MTARDAWIQADANRCEFSLFLLITPQILSSISFADKGKNKCVVYRAFASRGLGVGAKNYIDDTSVPPGCQAAAAVITLP